MLTVLSLFACFTSSGPRGFPDDLTAVPFFGCAAAPLPRCRDAFNDYTVISTVVAKVLATLMEVATIILAPTDLKLLIMIAGAQVQPKLMAVVSTVGMPNLMTIAIKCAIETVMAITLITATGLVVRMVKMIVTLVGLMRRG